MDLAIERREADGVGVFTLTEGGSAIATLDYRRTDPRVVRIDFVEVSPRRRGEGLGQRLVAAAVDWARQDGLTLVPVCGFARHVLESDAAFHDVLGRS